MCVSKEGGGGLVLPRHFLFLSFAIVFDQVTKSIEGLLPLPKIHNPNDPRRIEFKELEAEKNKNKSFLDDTDQTYSEAKRIVESFRRKHNHELWLIKQANDDEVQSLINQINTKEQAYVDLLGTVQTTHNEMGAALEIYKDLVASYYGEEIPNEIQKSIDAFEELYEAQLQTITEQRQVAGDVSIFTTKATPFEPTKARIQDTLRRVIPDAFSFQRGSRYVPHDMYARVHTGEVIAPPGSNKFGGGKTDIHITVTGNYLSEEIDEDRLARKVASATAKRLFDPITGKPITRVR